MEPMGPTNMAELEIWTRALCASMSNTSNVSVLYRIGDADWALKEWRKRRDVIVAAEREAEAARKAAELEAAEAAQKAMAAIFAEARAAEARNNARAALNAAPWEQRWTGRYIRSSGTRCDEASVELDYQSFKAFGSDGWVNLRRSAPWPADMGDPPPGWDGGAS